MTTSKRLASVIRRRKQVGKKYSPIAGNEVGKTEMLKRNRPKQRHRYKMETSCDLFVSRTVELGYINTKTGSFTFG